MLRLLLAACLVISCLPAATASSPVALTLSVRESSCPAGQTYCFDVASGSTADLAPGTTVQLTFHNTGTMVHEVLVTAGSNADTSHKDTTEDGKLAAIEDVPAGGWGNATFVVPATGSVYFWCGQPGHESLGMWVANGAVGAAAAKGSPGLDAALLAACVGAAALLLRRRA